MLELGAESRRLHQAVGEEAASAGLDALWAVGRFAPVLARAARRRGMRGFIESSEELDGISARLREYLRPGDALLVKGSRGMKMERLLDSLRAASACV